MKSFFQSLLFLSVSIFLVNFNCLLVAEKNVLSLFTSPQKLCLSEIDTIPQQTDFSSRSIKLATPTITHFKYKDGRTYFCIELRGSFPQELSELYNDFVHEQVELDGAQEEIHFYLYPANCARNFANMSISNDVHDNEYYCSKPLAYEESAQPNLKDISVEELKIYLFDNKVCFYTGAGISAAGNVPTMGGLVSKLPLLGPLPEKAVWQEIKNMIDSSELFWVRTITCAVEIYRR